MDWLAASLVLYSIYLIGKYNKWGWIVSTIAAILFIFISFKKEIYGMVALDCILVVLNTKNFIEWNKNKKHDNSN